jgi:hypothetical protein
MAMFYPNTVVLQTYCFTGHIRPASHIMLLAKWYVIPIGIQPELGQPTVVIFIHLQSALRMTARVRKIDKGAYLNHLNWNNYFSDWIRLEKCMQFIFV